MCQEPTELLWIGCLTELILILKFKFDALTPNVNSQTFWPKVISHVTNGTIFFICSTLALQLYLMRLEFQLDKLLQIDGEKDAGVKRRRKKCGKIEICSDELVFSCSDKFLIREESDCIQKSGDTHCFGETRKQGEKTWRKVKLEKVRRTVWIHQLTHYPFRSWCPECVAGGAKNWPHLRQEVGLIGEIPAICFDCCFLRDHPRGESVPLMVGREKRSKMMLARVVPFKGGGVDWLVGQLIRDLRKMVVHGKVILKSDQENAILDVFNDVRKQRGKRASPKGTSQSDVFPNEQCKILRKEFAHTS